ncbi:unnamed protein product [Moneuplotes crassus]|uniref:Uncharacterized protein n=1 Tax=Euplotes crassus TaxID=5936 RepID=A0AAD1XJI4_EUPCR|nr:unnamed protein product [Moneuplotes crassus]
MHYEQSVSPESCLLSSNGVCSSLVMNRWSMLSLSFSSCCQRSGLNLKSCSSDSLITFFSSCRLLTRLSFPKMPNKLLKVSLGLDLDLGLSFSFFLASSLTPWPILSKILIVFPQACLVNCPVLSRTSLPDCSDFSQASLVLSLRPEVLSQNLLVCSWKISPVVSNISFTLSSRASKNPFLKDFINWFFVCAKYLNIMIIAIPMWVI